MDKVYSRAMNDVLAADAAREFLEKLDDINNRELDEGLKLLGNFDPLFFKKAIEELGGLVR